MSPEMIKQVVSELRQQADEIEQLLPQIKTSLRVDGAAKSEQGVKLMRQFCALLRKSMANRAVIFLK